VKLIRDTWLIFERSLQVTLRNPVWIFFGLFQPLCLLLLFAPLLKPLSNNPAFGDAHYLVIFTPGLLVMGALFGTAFVGFGLIDDLRAGVIERMRVTPIDRRALLLGRSLRDVLVLLVQSLFLLSLAWFLGLNAPWFGVVCSIVLILLIGSAISMSSYAVALAVQSEDALAPIINFFLLPIQLLAGITLPLTMGPIWLQNLALFNPFSHAVSATRELFLGHYTSMTVFWGTFNIMGVLLVAFYVSSRFFQKTAE
jgi:ABC-2 type transport system permease protein